MIDLAGRDQAQSAPTPFVDAVDGARHNSRLG